MKYLIVKSHVPSFDYQVVMERDEVIRYKRKKTDSSGWIWCTNSRGESCWIPENWVEFLGAQGVLKREYNSKELAVHAGDKVEVHLIESGWAWISTAADETGWIPQECLKRD